MRSCNESSGKEGIFWENILTLENLLMQLSKTLQDFVFLCAHIGDQQMLFSWEYVEKKVTEATKHTFCKVKIFY